MLYLCKMTLEDFKELVKDLDSFKEDANMQNFFMTLKGNSELMKRFDETFKDYITKRNG